MKIIKEVKRAGINAAFAGTSLLLLAGNRSVQAQAAEIKIVSPGEYKDIEGEAGVDNCCPPFRYQQVFPARDFAALGNQPHWITGFTWRPDYTVTSPLTVQLPDQDVRLSTTQRGPENLSLQFDDNPGSDVTQFYRGPFITVADAHSGPGPRAFYHVDFPAGVAPYLYDPTKGNLLFDVKAWQGESPARADSIPGIQTSLYAEPPTATHGERGGAIVFQFTFVPAIPTIGQLIINGSFETPDTSTVVAINAGQNTLAPWVVGGHSVQVGDAAGNGVLTGPAFEGAQYLDLNGLQRGRLTHSFATTPGLLYTVTFAYANNYFESSTPASATVRVFDGAGDRLNQTITHSSSVAGNFNWTVFSGEFTALQNTTSLEFNSLTDTNGYSGGIMLDAVQVFEGAALQVLSVTRAGNGPVLLQVRGVPKGLHRIQASADLNPDSFADIASVPANAAGLFLFQDPQAGVTRRFYRVAFP